ncbi:fucolectin-like [Ptychodera flava]|uniref:fucolectin-like n=1 Tax=Ptychodera flava TaxID=63121 RepID=UPI00396A6210
MADDKQTTLVLMEKSRYFHTTMIEISGDGESPEVKVCGHLEDEKGVEAKGEANVECESGPMVGRYVTIRKETTSLRSIYLCELKVIGKSQKPEVNSVNLQSVENEDCKLPKHLVNVALNKKAMQSSTSGNALDGTADKAIDGNKDSDLKEGQSCTLTKKEFGPWWKVDLGRAYDIYQIVITNRQDCCPFRIKSAEVRVGDSPNLEDNPVCGLVSSDSSATEETIAITCRCNTSMTGRYVSIQLADKTQVLHLCEVEVLVEK